MNTAHVLNTDCLTALRDMPDASVDAIVTDPPYGLSNTTPAQVADTITRWVTGDREYLPSARGFMGHEWDGFVPPVAVWDECLRVLKPGGHLLAFAGSRTHDLMTLGIRLAGFEIRDSVAWLYGSGFPKSMDVSKAIDKGGALSRPRALEFTAWMRSTGITAKQINEATGTLMGHHYTTHPTQPAIATADLFDKLRPHLPEVPERIERLVAERTGIEWTDYVKRPKVGEKQSGIAVPGEGQRYTVGGSKSVTVDVTAAHSDAAREWEGWGTALKPAHEPITLARKPLSGTVAANVQEHGTGALNIDATRIGTSDKLPTAGGTREMGNQVYGKGLGVSSGRSAELGGRWPANVVLDESQAAELDRQTGMLAGAGNKPGSMRTGWADGDAHERTSQVPTYSGGPSTVYGDSGGASRFFYVAKAPKSERPVVDGVAHSTVKPVTLMRWLVRMVTPPGGTVLDPFAGSGTTAEAALLEGFNVTAIEREADYLPLIQARIDRTTTALAAQAEADADTLFPIDEAAS